MFLSRRHYVLKLLHLAHKKDKNMISGWLKKPIIFLGLSMFISYGVMDMAIAQSPGRQSTSNIRINDLHSGFV
jgi:hypothetical protein